MNSTQQWQNVTWFEVDEHQEGQRIDNFLFTRLKGVPKSRIYRLIREGQVRVNKKRIKAETKLAIGDQIRVAPIRFEQKMKLMYLYPIKLLKACLAVWCMRMKVYW